MPEFAQGDINTYDLNQDQQLTQADVDFAIAIGMHSIAATISSILATGTGGGQLNVAQVATEMESEEYQAYVANPQETIAQFDISPSNPMFQSTLSSMPAPGTTKKVIDWSAFWTEVNIPAIGYDSIDDKLVVLKGTDHSADSSKDILVYDFITGTWTKGDTKIAGSDDMTNMITAPDTGELVIMHQNNSAGSHIKRFKAHQAASISSSTVNIVTPFFDFGSSGQKKRLYKVQVLCTGTNLNDLDIVASYDGDTDTYADIFSSNTFANNADAADWDTQTFTVASPTDFENISIKIYSTGAMTTANWGISEIAFIYRVKGIR